MNTLLSSIINPLPLILLTLLLLCTLTYFSLPHPIPGIPYNLSSARSPLGDIPSMLRWKRRTRETFSWMTTQCHELNSPIVQVFVKPFMLPWVIVCDARECQDVLGRRGREFDRARFTTDVVQPILREHFFPMPSGTKQRAHRALLSDLMGPGFLNEVAAPRLYNATLALLTLWRLKSTLASHHPFAADEDIANAALDTIWAASVGREAGTTQSQIDLLSKSRHEISLPSHQDRPVVFPQAKVPYDVEAIRTVIGSMEVGLASPLPGLSYFFYLKLPHIRRAFARKDKMLNDALTDSRNRLSASDSLEKAEGSRDAVTSGMDFILRREYVQARKENRAPRLDTTVLKDELFGFLLAGHETTSTTLMWGVKFLADFQGVQSRLRAALREGMAVAVAEGRQPTYSEITASSIPYLDAVIEEVLRCGGTAAAHGRQCLIDTEFLGVKLPKGTNVLFMTNGPSFVKPSMYVDEELRSTSSREAKGRIPEWDPERMCEFRPERWLVEDGEGKLEMNWQAGPNTQFGGGSRGCFGKKFAYLEMRTVITIVFWNFKLLSVPAELSTYDAFDSVAHVPLQCYVRLEPL